MVKEESLKVLIVDEVIIKHLEELLLVVLRHNVLQKLERIPVVVPGAVPNLLIPRVTWGMNCKEKSSLSKARHYN